MGSASEGGHGWSWKAVDPCWTKHWQTKTCSTTCLFLWTFEGIDVLLQWCLGEIIRRVAYQVSRGRRMLFICGLVPDIGQQGTMMLDRKAKDCCQELRCIVVVHVCYAVVVLVEVAHGRRR